MSAKFLGAFPPPFFGPFPPHLTQPISYHLSIKSGNSLNPIIADVLHGWSLKGLTLQIEITAAADLLQAGGQGAAAGRTPERRQ